MRIMRLLLCLVSILFVAPIVFAFIAVPQANVSLDPKHPPFFLENTTLQSRPQVFFYILNSGSGTANVLNASLITDLNYVLLSAPSEIKSGYTSAFKYEFTDILCSLSGNNDFSFAMYYYRAPTNASLIGNISSNVYSFNIKDFLFLTDVSPSKNVIDVNILEGDAISFNVRNDADQPVSYSFNISYLPNLYLVFRSSEGEFSREEFDSRVFIISPNSVEHFEIEIIPTHVADDTAFSLNVQSIDCVNVTDDFSRNIRVLYYDEGLIFDRKIVPDLNLLSILLLFLIGGFVIFYFLN